MNLKDPIAYGVRQGEMLLTREKNTWCGMQGLGKWGLRDIALMGLSEAEDKAGNSNAEVVIFSLTVEDVDQKKPLGTYQTVREWIDRNRGCSGAYGLAKLVVGLFNYDLSTTPLRKCLTSLDGVRWAWAEDIVKDFFARGESTELKELAHWILDNEILSEG